MNPRTQGEWATDPTRARRWIGGLALVLAVSAGGVWLASRSDQGDGGSRQASNLRPLPAFSLRGFDGSLVTQAAISGRPAAINFFASTCPFCIHEMPAFERVHARMKGDVVFLGVALRDSEKAARELARQTGVTYRLAFDDSGSFYRTLRGIGMPVTVFVTPDGMIASMRSGPLDEAQLEELIGQTLAEARTG